MPTLDQILVRWLNIPVDEWPPNAYRWLGLPNFEDDEQKINEAADQLMSRLHKLKKESERRRTPHHKTLSFLMNQTERRRDILTNQHPRMSKAEYDSRLRREEVYFGLFPTGQLTSSSEPKEPPIVDAEAVDETETKINAPPVVLTSPPKRKKTRARHSQRQHTSGKVSSKLRRRRRQRRQLAWLIQFISIVLGGITGVVLGYFILIWMKYQFNITSSFTP